MQLEKRSHIAPKWRSRGPSLSPWPHTCRVASYRYHGQIALRSAFEWSPTEGSHTVFGLCWDQLASSEPGWDCQGDSSRDTLRPCLDSFLRLLRSPFLSFRRDIPRDVSLSPRRRQTFSTHSFLSTLSRRTYSRYSSRGDDRNPHEYSMSWHSYGRTSHPRRVPFNEPTFYPVRRPTLNFEKSL